MFAYFDDLSYSQQQYYRETTEFKTPELNHLAEQGIRFTVAHSASSVEPLTLWFASLENQH